MCRASAGKDVNLNLDQNKRNKHALLPEYSGASSDSMSNSISAAIPGKSSLMMQSTKYAVLSPQRHHHMFDDQGTFGEAPGAAKGYNTSGWSTDHDNNGDDECSGGHATSTFASSEEGGSSQHLQYCDPFLRADRSVSAFDHLERQVKKDEDEWPGGSSNLNWQLGSFINKEKQKLESSSSGGSSGGSKHSLSGSLHEYGSMGPPANIGRRSSESSASMSGFPEGSSTHAESSQPRHPTRITQPNTVSSTLLSKMKTSEGMKFQPIVDLKNTSVILASKSTSDEEERILLTDKLRGLRRSPFSTVRMEQEIHKLRSHDLHQKFVLSSGRVRQVEGMPSLSSLFNRSFECHGYFELRSHILS